MTQASSPWDEEEEVSTVERERADYGDIDAFLNGADEQPESHGGNHRTSVAGLFGLKEGRIQKNMDSIEQYDFDKDIYNDIYVQSTTMQQSVQAGSSELKAFDSLAQDAFAALYKHAPRLKGEDEIEDAGLFNRDLMEELMQTPEYQKLRANTRHDVLSSAIGTEVLTEEAVTKIKMIKKQMNQQHQQDPQANPMSGDQFFDLLNQIHDASQAAQQAQNQLAGLPGAPGGQQQGQGQQAGPTGQTNTGAGSQYMTPEMAKALAAAAQQQQQQAEAALQQAQQQLQQAQAAGQNPMSALHQAMQQAAKSAENTVSEVNEFVQAWGLEGGDKNRRVTYEDKKRALSRLRQSTKLKKLTDLIGRFRQIAMDDKKRKSNEGSSTVKSVITGNKLENILPSEKMHLGHESTKMNFYRKYQEKGLLMYDKESTKTQGRGPILTLVDESGSMDGKPEQWSKALALAVLEIAQKQKRAYGYIGFGSNVAQVHEIPYGSLKPDTVFDIAENFNGGGTNFEAPLKRALEMMNKQKFKKGDILFITDGSAGISPEFLKKFNQAKKEKEFTVRTILINCGNYASDGIVKEFSDEIIKLSNLSELNDNNAAKIFADLNADPSSSASTTP